MVINKCVEISSRYIILKIRRGVVEFEKRGMKGKFGWKGFFRYNEN